MKLEPEVHLGKSGSPAAEVCRDAFIQVQGPPGVLQELIHPGPSQVPQQVWEGEPGFSGDSDE